MKCLYENKTEFHESWHKTSYARGSHYINCTLLLLLKDTQ